jgi:MOSC domain-containing protein YiiM
MKLISINVGKARLILWKGQSVSTSIFKDPIAGEVQLRKLNLDGDRQSDLSVHGGPNKAAYPSEHYEYWRRELSLATLGWGAFGENFTTQGMLESEVYVADRYRIGAAIVRVTTPRLPCFKLAAKFGRDDMIQRFLLSGTSGFYFAVEEEGGVGSGEEFELLHRDNDGLSIANVYRLYSARDPDSGLLRRAAGLATLPESWRQHFQAKVERSDTPA